MNFKTEKKDYELISDLRDKIKPNWQEMLKPARERKLQSVFYESVPFVIEAEKNLSIFNETLIGKDILEIGCAYGERSFLMAKYEGTKVHGIDTDEYICDQSPDLNSWNPKDTEFVHNNLCALHNELANNVPKSVANKVTFETNRIEGYVTPKPHDVIISWDVLEHILDLPLAFTQMANSVKKGGIVYHEYNPFFSVNGGHSLCTIDFVYGHCRLSAKDFERYIRDIRPEEEKIDLNFYYKCLNRATKSDIKELSEKNGFEILEFQGKSYFGNVIEQSKEVIDKEILKEVQINYPKVTLDDLLYDSVHLILRKL